MCEVSRCDESVKARGAWIHFHVHRVAENWCWNNFKIHIQILSWIWCYLRLAEICFSKTIPIFKDVSSCLYWTFPTHLISFTMAQAVYLWAIFTWWNSFIFAGTEITFNNWFSVAKVKSALSQAVVNKLLHGVVHLLRKCRVDVKRSLNKTFLESHRVCSN